MRLVAVLVTMMATMAFASVLTKVGTEGKTLEERVSIVNIRETGMVIDG